LTAAATLGIGVRWSKTTGREVLVEAAMTDELHNAILSINNSDGFCFH
jgi:hypothetical protein